MLKDWYIYNHALLSKAEPHENPNLEELNTVGLKFMLKNKIILARWTSDWNTAKETGFWYVIKDDQFDINLLKAKRRYEINKGLKNFDTREINLLDEKGEIARINKAAFDAYPIKYRPKFIEAEFEAEIIELNSFYKAIGAFEKSTGLLQGYILYRKSDKVLYFDVLKTNPACEKDGINAALVAGLLYESGNFINEKGYILDGAKSIYHETNFQAYLEKYFGFKRVNCVLHIKYNPLVYFLVKSVYPFRAAFYKSNNRLACKVAAILKMEEIRRTYKQED